MAERQQITLGYVPLIDSAALIIAREKGFAGDEGIDLRLKREISWQTIRDRVAVGHFEGALMQAPMPVAAALGLDPVPSALMTPLVLSLGGGGIAVSKPLYHAMLDEGLSLADLQPERVGTAFKTVTDKRRRRTLPPLRLAVAHIHSSQAYQLLYWLAACDIRPGRDVELVELPSLLMVDALATDKIDGFTASEPWLSVAVDRDIGRLALADSMIWQGGPDKVLGLSASWAEAHPQATDALLRACYRAGEWCANPANLEELAAILSAPHHLGVEARLITPSLTGQLSLAPGVHAFIADFLVLDPPLTGFPWQSYGLWFYTQMIRWGHARFDPGAVQGVRDCYRTDLYRRALRPIFAPLPQGDLRREDYNERHGAGFFDARVFDPEAFEAYLENP
ncbi:CmpA/NrtA family ABC transporter substrate-binding protein [Rhizobium paknamense]|uniref:NitT/TauT family transport system ATP-binding protein n=1 Tax=Rhizobium paknamense TaxID=1206817 RepID=A0ABU0IBC3_9HYPH|nr:CmpA/NrtA family ABC transporter substrate-binding protein [Rhizobium paknamense]MDQ0455002.1 NitT/TauT family transport system ATP-binding protein [Rhizobium paknamense]